VLHTRKTKERTNNRTSSRRKNGGNKEFNEGESDFTARTGRTDRREKLYGVRKLSSYEEKLSAD
jgi:hypothetical protein